MPSHSSIRNLVTPTWRRAERLPTRGWLLLLVALTLPAAVAHAQSSGAPAGGAAAATAQPANAAGAAPAANVTPSELELLRADLKRQAEADRNRMDADEAAIARLATQLQEEHALRLGAEAARVAADNARPQTPVVQAGRLQLRLSGFVQLDAIAYSQAAQDQLNPSTGAPLNDTRFLIRRARLRADIDWRFLQAAMEFDGNTTNGYTARIIGVEVSALWRNPDNSTIPYVQLTAGSFKTPFGFEVTQRDTDRLFLERSTMEHAFFPGEYDLGARLQGGWRFLRYQVAAMNGDPIGEKQFPGRDPNQSKDVMGRLGVELALAKLFGISGGASGLWGTGFHSGTPATKDTLVWRDTNQDNAVEVNEISVIQGTTALPSKNFTRWAVGGDLRLSFTTRQLGQTLLYGELTYAANLDRGILVADPVVAQRDLRELGYYVGLTQELTPWAAVGVRYDYYDPDRDGNRLQNGVQVANDPTYSSWAFTAAARYPGYARFTAEYDHNANALGLTTAGLPTTLKNDQFILRAEMKF